MADRTGHPEFDALVERFVAENPPLVDADVMDPPRWEAYTIGTVREMRHPHIARRHCGEMSDLFVAWLAQRGVAARASDSDGIDSWQAHGYDDAPVAPPDRDPTHVSVLVELDGQTFSIDWTASQYGYESFPLVQRQAGDGSWQREWPKHLAPPLTDLDAAAHLPPVAVDAVQRGVAQ